MALTTQSVNENSADKDNTPEYYVKLDSEGKGYLAKKEVKIEEPVEEEKPKFKSKRRGKK